MSPEPVQLMKQIEQQAAQLDKASSALYSAITDQAQAERDYTLALEKELIALVDRYEDEGKRIPAEDIRKARAHKAVGQEVYANYLAATARVSAIKAKAKVVESSLSARQSLLAALRAEARA